MGVGGASFLKFWQASGCTRSKVWRLTVGALALLWDDQAGPHTPHPTCSLALGLPFSCPGPQKGATEGSQRKQTLRLTL